MKVIQKIKKLLALALITTLAWGLIHASPSHAGVGDKVYSSTTATVVSHFEIDASRNRLYATDENVGVVRVIDLNNMSELSAIDVGMEAYDLSLSNSGDELWVTTQNEGLGQIVILDLDDLEIIFSIPLPELGYEIDMGNHYAYVTSSNSFNGTMRIDLANNRYVNSFTEGMFMYHKAMLKISPDKSQLFVANRGLSPISLGVFNISGEHPVLENLVQNIGSNGQSLDVDPNQGNFVSVAAGSGNTVDYDTYILNTNELSVFNTVDTEAFPRAVLYGNDGLSLYTSHTVNSVHVWDVITGALVNTISIDGQAKVMALSPDGAFLIISDKQQRFDIYQIAELDDTAVPPELSGDLEGGHITKLICYNKTTSQYFSVKLVDETSWDCVEHGLVIQPGDNIRIAINASIN